MIDILYKSRSRFITIVLNTQLGMGRLRLFGLNLHSGSDFSLLMKKLGLGPSPTLELRPDPSLNAVKTEQT
jgi:hypothetical protein